LRGEEATLVFYETPHRILEALSDIATVMGTREVVVARELTKLHEEVLRGPAEEIRATLAGRDSVRGEFVVLISKATEADTGGLTPQEAISRLVQAGVPKMDAIKTVAKERGLNKRDVYKLVSGD
jgi:16S rRNA (cytidine1402-2'-O)-methyltransferase